ncbi:SchA/CurD-like domain-containing protein [Micromonospora sp. CPCC 206061]|uniref:SchA/CurD-like domain-containing protein n=1 Tax=Micromonospora sp. CPCC 206061 TaxID=3122410 RepID=UPI002FF33ADF
MTFAAITYPVAFGHEEEIADIFSRRNFKRANSPILRNAAGERVGMLMGTGLFIRHDRMARLIQFRGDVDDVARHMAMQEGVQEAERRLAPLLREPRDTTTVEGFLAYFSRSLMRCVTQSIVDDQPIAGLYATSATLAEHDGGDDVDVLLKELVGEQWAAAGGPIVATAAFRHSRTVLRIVQYEDGAWEQALATLAADPDVVAGERRLAAHLVSTPAPADGATFAAALRTSGMRCLSQLSIAGMRFAK